MSLNLQTDGELFVSAISATTSAPVDAAIPAANATTISPSAQKCVVVAEIASADGSTDIDIILYGRMRGSGGWQVVPGGDVDDLETETDDRKVFILDDPFIYDALYLRMNTYTAAGTLSAWYTEIG